MNSNQNPDLNNITGRPDRRKRFYNSTERGIIDPFKTAYLQAENAAQRRDIAITKVFPLLFTHWEKEENRRLEEDERKERTQDLLVWLRNNWRLEASETLAANFVVKRTDVLWVYRQEKVFAEIAKLLGVDKADTKTKGWFNKCMQAMGNIIERMTDEEKTALDQEAARILREGYPDEQKYKLSRKYASVRFDRMAKNHWLEMGIVSFSFVISRTPTGQLGIEVHDHMAEMLGVNASPFEEAWPNEVMEMERLLTNYVRNLHSPVPGTTTDATADHIRQNTDLGYLGLERNPDGYPVISKGFKPSQHKKSPLEAMFRKYLSIHYELATNRRTQQVPYADLEMDLSKYIDKQYLPNKFGICEPRNMKKKQVISFFEHIMDRQVKHDMSNVFRFKNVNIGRPKRIVPAYTKETADAIPTDTSARPKAMRKPKGKGKSKETTQGANETERINEHFAEFSCNGNLGATETPTPQSHNFDMEINALQSSNSNIDPRLLDSNSLIALESASAPYAGMSRGRLQPGGASTSLNTPPLTPINPSQSPPNNQSNDSPNNPAMVPMPRLSPLTVWPTPSPTPAPSVSLPTDSGNHHVIIAQQSQHELLSSHQSTRNNTLQVPNARPIPTPQFGPPFVFPPAEDMTPVPGTASASALNTSQGRQSKKHNRTADDRAMDEAVSYRVKGKRVVKPPKHFQG